MFNKELQTTTNVGETFAKYMYNASDSVKAQAEQLVVLKAKLRDGVISQKEYNEQSKQIIKSNDNIAKSQARMAIGAKAASIAMNMLFSVGIAALITVSIKVLDTFVNRLDKLKDKADEAKRVYEESQSELDDVNKKIEDNRLEIEEINKNPLDITNEETLKTLKNENEELVKQKGILEQINQTNKDKSAKASEEYLTGNGSRMASAWDLVWKGEWEKANNVYSQGNQNIKATPDFTDFLGMVSPSISAINIFNKFVGDTVDYVSETEMAVSELNGALAKRNELLKGGVTKDEEVEFAKLNSEITSLNTTITTNLEEINNYKNTLDPTSIAYQRITEFENKYNNMLDTINQGRLYDAINEDFDKARKQIEKSNSFTLTLGKGSEISQDIIDLFDEYGDSKSVKYFNDATITGNLNEQQEKLRNIISLLNQKNTLTQDESELLDVVKNKYNEIVGITSEYGDAYTKGIQAKSQILFDNYTKANPMSNTKLINYDNWYDGLLASANGDKAVEAQIKAHVDLVFPKEDVIANNIRQIIDSGEFKEQIESITELAKNGTLDINNLGTFSSLKAKLSEYGIGLRDFMNIVYQNVVADNDKIDKSYSSLGDTITDLENKQSLLSTTQKELAEDGELSFGTISKLIEAGLEYSDIIDIETGQYKDVATVLRDVTKAKYEDEIATMRLTAAEAQHNIVSSAQSGGDFSAYMQQYNDILEEIDIKEKLLEQYYNTEYTPSSSKKSDDPWKEAFEKELKDLQFAKDMELITEKQYYIELEKLNDKYFKGREEYLDEYRKYVVEIYNYQKKLKEQEIQDEIEYLNDLKDAYKTYLEDSQEDLLKPIEDRIEALKEENAQIEKTNKMLEAQKKLEEALQRKNYVYRKGAGFVYEQDQEAVKDAKDEIAKIKREDEIESLEDYRDDVKDKMSETLESIDEFFKTATDKLNGEDKPVNNPDVLNNGTLSAGEIANINSMAGYQLISTEDLLKTIGATRNMSEEEFAKILNVVQPTKLMDSVQSAVDKETTSIVRDNSSINIGSGAVVLTINGDVDENTLSTIRREINDAFITLANNIESKRTQNQFRRG